ncbi:MAG: PDZ domain-containing protein [Ferruginibacter sp.]
MQILKRVFLLVLAGCLFQVTIGQSNASLFRYPDISKTQVAFTYANDIWVVSKIGGVATRLSSPAGSEMFPKFSPDGTMLAFTGNYDGNKDIYVLPVQGGVPRRITEHGSADRLTDWTNDGKKLLFASSRESGKYRFSQFFTIPLAGGQAEKLPLAYAEFGSYSPDGNQMALIFRSQAFRNWKRYRGGWNADIHIYNFAAKTDLNISADTDAADEFPMWSGNYIYFSSDRGPENRMNLWRYNVSSKAYEQLTRYTDFDIHFPSLGPDDIVYEQGGHLYRFELAAQKPVVINVTVITDESTLKTYSTSVEKYIGHTGISPDGSRVLVEARGDIFSVPAKEGFVKNLTMSSGVAERTPAWSPDGRTLAWWSDKSGEYELWLAPAGHEQDARKVTGYGPGFRYRLYWSPDSKMLAFMDKTGTIKVVNAATGSTSDVDQGLRYTHGNMEGFVAKWSMDSRWMAYDRDLDNAHTAVFIYDTEGKKTHQVTSGFYSASEPAFDPLGKYLYLVTNQAFNPYYSDFDNSFIYANSSALAAIALQKNTPSLLAPKNDTVALSPQHTPPGVDSARKEKEKKEKKAVKEEKQEKKDINIDFADIESRLEVLPVTPGNLGNVQAAKGKIIYLRKNNTGTKQGPGSLKYYDLEKKEEKTITEGLDDYELSADKQKLLLVKGESYYVTDVSENVKTDKSLNTKQMMASVDPRAEWMQIFTDAWRLERDYFYDPNMHGVNWKQVRERYGAMVKEAMTREDVSFIIGEMIGELNASHTYYSGGDLENEKTVNTGYLGVDWKAVGDYYQVENILKGASWDAEARSPLSLSGTGPKEGDYILAVNGVPLKTTEEPYGAFSGLAGSTVELTWNNKAGWEGAKTTVVKTLPGEYRLRHLAWIESMRKRVDEATNGQAGYIYVTSTGVEGQTEMMRQLNAQTDKKALIIDERFNDGGQIPDRFIEMLNRQPLAYWAIRDGKAWPWPPNAAFGPKVMLMNGWSGSGGDAFPDYFRKRGLGPLIGMRTWGGLIGISGVPSLVDNGNITVPTFRMLNIDGTWFKEGHGVDPDIEVPEDLGAMAKGIDPQLERAITEIKTLLKTKGFAEPKIPGYEVR